MNATNLSALLVGSSVSVNGRKYTVKNAGSAVLTLSGARGGEHLLVQNEKTGCLFLVSGMKPGVLVTEFAA